MSVDPAHSLADSFDLEGALFHGATAEPKPLQPNLWIQEVNIQREIKRHWNEIATYITSVLRTTGLSSVEAEEMAIFPGMEELSAMMYVNQYMKEKQFDVVVLDCAPTAESLRFVSLPTTLDWYMKHIFSIQRRVMKAVRPIVNTIATHPGAARQLLRQHSKSVSKNPGHRRGSGGPQDHQRPAGDQS